MPFLSLITAIFFFTALSAAGGDVEKDMRGCEKTIQAITGKKMELRMVTETFPATDDIPAYTRVFFLSEQPFNRDDSGRLIPYSRQIFGTMFEGINRYTEEHSAMLRLPFPGDLPYIESDPEKVLLHQDYLGMAEGETISKEIWLLFHYYGGTGKD